MAKKIENLTPDQIARFPEFVRRWTDIGLSTEPADRPCAEAAIRDMYRCAGLEPPQKIVWCGSPLSQGITRAIILDKKRAGVGASVRASVGASVRASVRDSVWDSVGASVGDSVYGQHDADWLAFYRYFFEVLGLQRQTKKLTGLWSLAEAAGWALPHKNICWVSERHHILQRDGRGRLHSLVGPACAFPDGWAIYAVNGVRVPAHWVENRDTLDPAEGLKAQNVEQRAAGAAIVGWPKMISKLKRRVIDGNPDTDIGALIELTLPGLPEPGRFLQAKCPRNGTIVEGVPRISDIDNLPIETVIAAQAWRVGDPQSEYMHPPKRT